MNENRIFFFISSLLIITGLYGGVRSQTTGTCPAGFVGPQCAVCQNNAACVGKTNNAEATCNTSFHFSSNSTVKSYSCDPSSPSLVTGLLEPNSMLLQCHTGLALAMSGTGTPPAPLAAAPQPAVFGSTPPPPEALAPSGEVSAPAPESSLLQDLGRLFSNITGGGGIGSLLNGRRLLQADGGATVPFCDLSFMVQDPNVLVKCKADSCSMQTGSPAVTCQQAACSCSEDPSCGNSSLVSSLVGTVNGRVEINCTDSGTCTIKLGGFPISSIGANCTTGECLVPTDANSNTTVGTPPPSNNTGQDTVVESTSVNNLSANAVIAAIPAILLTFIVLFVGSYTFSRRALWQNHPGEPPTSDSQLTSVLPLGHKVKQLEFRDVTVTVPMDKKTAEKKRVALRNKALIRHDSMNVFHNHTNTLIHKLQKNARERLGLKTSDDVELPASITTTDISTGSSANMAAAAEYVANLHDGGSPGTWRILGECSGIASAGEVVGVLGPSGCGKTTLLSALTGSATDLGAGAMLQGSVLVDGVPRRGREVAYVPQADYFIPTLTVQECIRYSALLRLPEDTSPAEMQLRVDYVLHELGLRHIADSQVGGSGNIRGVSGGERRRVTIGMELVNDPSILVLDEPTSGLDSFTAINLVRSLRQVALGGRVVIASLHQPSKDMFFALDQVILMGHGRMLFMGHPEEAESALAAAGVPCPPDTAIAEHMLKVASSASDIVAMLRAREEGTSDQQHQMQMGGAGEAAKTSFAGMSPGSIHAVDRFDAGGAAIHGPAHHPSSGSEEGGSFDAASGSNSADGMGIESAGMDISNAKTLSPEVGGVAEATFDAARGEYVDRNSATSAVPRRSSAARHPRSGFSRQLAVMFWRTWVDMARNPTLMFLHLTISVCVGVIIGAIFFDLSDDSVGVQNRMGGTFFALAFLAFTSLTTVDLLMNERAVVMREVRSGYYRPTTYLLSKLALDGMLLRVVPAILFWLPFYYMAGFRTGSPYAATYLFTLVAFNCAVGALSMVVTVASSTAGQASFIMNFILLFSLAFTGFLVNVNSIPSVLRWIHYLSVFYYAFEAMLTNELNGAKFLFKYQANPSSPAVEIPDITGETFLSSLGFNTNRTTIDIGILVAMYAGFILLALLFFLLRLPRTRRVRNTRTVAAALGTKHRRTPSQAPGTR